MSKTKTSDISVEQILVSANTHSEIFKEFTKGTLKYTSDPDGLKEFSLNTFAMINPDSKQDSMFYVLEDILSKTSDLHTSSMLRIGSVDIVFDEEYSQDELFGICNISEIGRKGNTFVLYFAYRCGKSCGNGYVIVGEYINSSEGFDIRNVYNVWAANSPE